MVADEIARGQTIVGRRIAIIVGHNSKAQGAVRVTDGVSEYVWNGRLADEIQNLDPANVRVFRRVAAASYGAEIRACYAQVDAWGADVSCELHFNASAGGATGTETLYATTAGKSVALKVQAQMVSALGLKDRGLLQRTTGNGAGALLAGKAPAVLVETYFGSNVGDCGRADERFVALARGIFSGLGGEVAPSSAPIPPVEATLEERISAIEYRLDVAGI